MNGGPTGKPLRSLAHRASGGATDPEVSQVSQGVASRCDTRSGFVSVRKDKENARSVASVAGCSEEMAELQEQRVSVTRKQQHKKFALADSASPATLPGVLRHLRHLDERQAIQELARGKCRKTRCDSVATLATLARRRAGRR